MFTIFYKFCITDDVMIRVDDEGGEYGKVAKKSAKPDDIVTLNRLN